MISRFSSLLLYVLLFFLGVNALVGGLLLMISPDGALLGMRKDWLLASPFENYYIPGLLLFIFLGLVPAISFIGLIKPNALNFPERLNLFPNKHWAWAFSLYSGLIAMLWIILQQIMTPYFWIQSLILLNGWGIVVLCLLQAVQDKFLIKKKD